MWPFVNPLECKVAEQCLARDNPLEAARALLASSQPGHRAVRELLLRIAPQLVDQGRRAAEANDVLVAAELLDTAARCGSLTPEDEALRRRVTEQRDELARDRQWREQRLERAAEWARDGRLRSALGLVGPLDADQEAARHRRDWQFDLERLDRYVAEFQQHLAAEQMDAAAAVLAKAAQLAGHEPQVLAMRQTLDEVRGPAAKGDADRRESPGVTVSYVAPPEARSQLPLADPARPQPDASPYSCRISGDSSGTCVLSGLDAYGDVYVVTRPHVLIGTPRERGVDVPISARIHGRHAILVRESLGRGGEGWRIMPLSNASVKVNGGDVTAPATRRLADGDVLQLGSDLCRWTFRLPLAGSGTAVLDVVRPTASGVAMTDGATACCVVLVADRLVIADDRREGHLVQRDSPARRLVLEPTSAGWQVSSDETPVFAESDRLPADVTLYADDADLARQIVCGSREPRKQVKWTLGIRRA